MGGINARVSRAAWLSPKITPFWKKKKKLRRMSIQLEMRQTVPAQALKNGNAIFQEWLTETLRGVFTTGMSRRMSPTSHASILAKLSRRP